MRATRGFLIVIFLLPLPACDANTPESPQDVDVPRGIYQEFGERSVVDGDVAYEGVAGVYFQRTFHFRTDRELTIDIASDYNPEIGTAMGRYQTNGKSLRVTIDSSTSSYYESGESIEYDDATVVDESFHTSFSVDETEIEFTGPGLVLSRVDGDETRKEYFKLQESAK